MKKRKDFLFGIGLLSSLVLFSHLYRENQDLKKENQRLELLTVTEPLTGLWNLRYFNKVVPELQQRLDHNDEPAVILFVDVDDFKDINNIFGHDVGDYVLKAIAKILEDEVRPNDVLVRYGGDEFLVYLPKTTKAEATTIARRLCQAVKDQVEGIAITVSVGVSPEVTNLDEDIRRADAAHSKAKRLGKDGVWAF